MKFNLKNNAIKNYFFLFYFSKKNTFHDRVNSGTDFFVLSIWNQFVCVSKKEKFITDFVNSRNFFFLKSDFFFFFFFWFLTFVCSCESSSMQAGRWSAQVSQPLGGVGGGESLCLIWSLKSFFTKFEYKAERLGWNSGKPHGAKCEK